MTSYAQWNTTQSVTSLTTSDVTSLATTTEVTPGATSGGSWMTTFVYVIFGLGAAILVVAIILVAMLLVRYRRRRKLQEAKTAKVDVVHIRSFSSQGVSRFYDRRLTGSSINAVTCHEGGGGEIGGSTPDSCDLENANGAEFVWYTGNRSTSGSTPTRSSGETLTTSGTASAHSDTGGFIGPYEGHFLEYGEDADMQYATVHRSSPLATLAALYSGNHVVSVPPYDTLSPSLHRSCHDNKIRDNIAAISGNSRTPTEYVGVINGGFINDVETVYGNTSDPNKSAGLMTTSTPIAAIESWWSRLSWRAKLRAGISGSISSATSESTSERRRSTLSPDLAVRRRRSYLTEVLESVRFFSGDLRSTSTDRFTDNTVTVNEGWVPTPAQDRVTSSVTGRGALPHPETRVDHIRPIGDAVFYGGGEWCLRRPGTDDVGVSKSISASFGANQPVNHRRSRLRQRQSSITSGDSSSDGLEVVVVDGRQLPSSRYSNNGRQSVATPGEYRCPNNYYTYGQPIAAFGETKAVYY